MVVRTLSTVAARRRLDVKDVPVAGAARALLDTGAGAASTGRLTMSLEGALPAGEAHDLLAKVLAGDRKAARVFTESILLPVLDVAVARMLHTRKDGRFEKDDVVQEIWGHFHEDDWRRLRSFDPARGSLVNYIWAIARAWVRDHSRRMPPPEPAEDPEKDLPPDSGPESKVELAEILDRIQEALTDEEMALFQGVYFEHVKSEELARRLGIKLEAFHKRVQRMEAKVRAVLSFDPENPDKRGGP